MKQCLFSILFCLSTCGLFAGNPLESPSTKSLCTLPIHNPKAMFAKDVQCVKGGSKEGKFNPALKQAFLLLTDPVSLTDSTPSSFTGYPFLVPLRTPSAASEDVNFHPVSSTFTIKKTGTYWIEYFVKLSIAMAGSKFQELQGQLEVAVNVNDHFVGKAKIPAARVTNGGVSPLSTSCISGSRLIFHRLEKGDVVSLYLLSPPEISGGSGVSPVGMSFGLEAVSSGAFIFVPNNGPDIVAYLKLKKIS